MHANRWIKDFQLDAIHFEFDCGQLITFSSFPSYLQVYVTVDIELIYKHKWIYVRTLTLHTDPLSAINQQIRQSSYSIPYLND